MKAPGRNFFLLLLPSLSTASSRLLGRVSRPQAAPQSQQTWQSLCAEEPTNYYPGCWEGLAIADYLTNWTNSTPDCSVTNGNGSDCCFFSSPGESWSTCFNRIVVGDQSFCNSANITEVEANDASRGTCDESPLGELAERLRNGGEDVDMEVLRKQIYVVRAVIDIHGVFVTWAQGRCFFFSLSLTHTSWLLIRGVSFIGCMADMFREKH